MTTMVFPPVCSGRARLILLDHLSSIHGQTMDLAILLASVDYPPEKLEADALRVLHRLDGELADLLQRVGDAGPG